jgi:hypothetical protein
MPEERRVMVDFNKKLAEYKAIKDKEKTMAAPSIRDRIKQIASQTAPSMVPVPREEEIPAPPEKEEEAVPDISELVTDVKTRLELARMVNRYGELGLLKSPIAKEQKKLSEAMKKIAGKWKVGRAIVGDWRLAYYNSPRESLSEQLLLEAGVSIDIIKKCRVKKDSYTIRVMPVVGDDSGEDE